MAMDLNQALDPATSQRLASDAGIHGAFILSVGSLTGRKRMDLLVEAMRYLRPGIDLVVVGQGPLRAQLEHTLAASGMRGRVHLLDAVDASTLQALQQQAEASVLVSEREGLPTSIIESVRVGTPAVYCTTSPVQLRATGPYLRHLVTSSPTRIAEEIDSTLAQSSGEPNHRESVLNWAREAFPDLRATSEILKRLYEELLAGGT